MTGPARRPSRRELQARLRAARVVSAQRRDPGLSLSAAAAREGVAPRTVRRYFGRWYRRGARGMQRPAAFDDEPFDMNVYSTRGVVTVATASSDDRALIGQHTAAIWQYRDTGNVSQLARFRGQHVAGVILETDPERLLRMVWTGPDYLEIYNI
jgi:hypothetical protein